MKARESLAKDLTNAHNDLDRSIKKISAKEAEIDHFHLENDKIHF